MKTINHNQHIKGVVVCSGDVWLSRKCIPITSSVIAVTVRHCGAHEASWSITAVQIPAGEPPLIHRFVFTVVAFWFQCKYISLKTSGQWIPNQFISVTENSWVHSASGYRGGSPPSVLSAGFPSPAGQLPRCSRSTPSVCSCSRSSNSTGMAWNLFLVCMSS